MSKALGQNEGYISKIERGYTLPSLSGFFYICEYLDVPPKYFLDDEIEYPLELLKAIDILKELDEEQFAHVTWFLQAIAKTKREQNKRDD